VSLKRKQKKKTFSKGEDSRMATDTVEEKKKNRHGSSGTGTIPNVGLQSSWGNSPQLEEDGGR